MIDISEKKDVKRFAEAQGKIFLKKTTIDAIRKREVKKGDPLETAKIAGFGAIKKTPELLAYCHQIPIEAVMFDFEIEDERIIVKCGVSATAKTGVEMEALMGVTIALNTIWDMVKYLEKDKDGQYLDTRLCGIRVTKKVKG